MNSPLLNNPLILFFISIAAIAIFLIILVVVLYFISYFTFLVPCAYANFRDNLKERYGGRLPRLIAITTGLTSILIGAALLVTCYSKVIFATVGIYFLAVGVFFLFLKRRSVQVSI